MERVKTHNQTFSSPGDALAHYGKKGMRWGVRNEDDSSGDGSGGTSSGSKGGSKPSEPSKEDLHKAADAVFSKTTPAALKAEGQAKLAAQAANDHPPSAKQVKRDAKADKIQEQADSWDKQAQEFRAKAESLKGQSGVKATLQRKGMEASARDAEMYRDQALKKAEQVRSGKLTDNQKVLIGAGALAAVAVAGAYGHRQYQLKQAGISKRDIKREEARNRAEHERQFNEIFGDHPGFNSAMTGDTAGTVGFFGGLGNKKAFDRPEFTISKDTVFQRLSNHPEDSAEYGVNRPVYSTFLSNDKKIYGSSTEFGYKGISVNFTAKTDTRVPTIATTTAHLKQVLKSNNPDKDPSWWTDERVFYEYQQMSGGDWASPTAQKLFSSLKSFGYGAIVDDMDAGFLGDAPVVFFGDAAGHTHVERPKDAKIRDSVGLFKTSGKYA